MTPAEFDTLASARSPKGSASNASLPESLTTCGCRANWKPSFRWVSRLGQFRIIEPPVECWANVFKSGSCAYYDTREDSQSANQIENYSKPTRVAVHMREVGAETATQFTVIGGKTLDTGAPGERVAILASRDDLNFIIAALKGGIMDRNDPGLNDFLHGLCELRQKAFGL